MRKSCLFTIALITITAQSATAWDVRRPDRPQLQQYTLSLSANPPGSATVGQAITLTATAKPSGNYRFTYEAQRQWPCQETIAISGNGASTTWVPPANKAGDYKLVVKFKVSPPFAAVSINYKVTNVGGLGYISVSPSATSVSASVPPPGSGSFTYRWRLYCATQAGNAHCTNGPFAPVEGAQNTANWTVATTGSGQIRFDVNVDVANTATCNLQQGFAYAFLNVP